MLCRGSGGSHTRTAHQIRRVPLGGTRRCKPLSSQHQTDVVFALRSDCSLAMLEETRPHLGIRRRLARLEIGVPVLAHSEGLGKGQFSCQSALSSSFFSPCRRDAWQAESGRQGTIRSNGDEYLAKTCRGPVRRTRAIVIVIMQTWSVDKGLEVTAMDSGIDKRPGQGRLCCIVCAAVASRQTLASQSRGRPQVISAVQRLNTRSTKTIATRRQRGIAL